MKVYDIEPPKSWLKAKKLAAERRHINKFFNSLDTRGAIVDNKAILLVYNSKAPELSYILVEPL